jgi:hypothetical protein
LRESVIYRLHVEVMLLDISRNNMELVRSLKAAVLKDHGLLFKLIIMLEERYLILVILLSIITVVLKKY